MHLYFFYPGITWNDSTSWSFSKNFPAETSHYFNIRWVSSWHSHKIKVISYFPISEQAAESNTCLLANASSWQYHQVGCSQNVSNNAICFKERFGWLGYYGMTNEDVQFTKEMPPKTVSNETFCRDFCLGNATVKHFALDGYSCYCMTYPKKCKEN